MESQQADQRELGILSRLRNRLISKELPLFGVQFHPESILTDCGYELLGNFLRLAGLSISADPAEHAAAEKSFI
jgi:hypothetical protein